MNATIIMLARLAAIKAAKRAIQARGGKPGHTDQRIILAAANAYFSERPELIEPAGKICQDDKWSFCLTAGTLCPTNQEKQ